MKKTTKALQKEANSLNQTFAKKIKTVQEVLKIIGSPPRKKKIVMCHGTFDVVHPGHIRQLIYAKSKGDVLIVSLTVDKNQNLFDEIIVTITPFLVGGKDAVSIIEGKGFSKIAKSRKLKLEKILRLENEVILCYAKSK
jgi:cytidyltransferase-like protein